MALECLQGQTFAAGSNLTKKKRRQKRRAPQSLHLEELLRSGEAALYGQVCWSIANRGTERPRPGEVITLEGVDDTGDRGHQSFRLTPESIENIERCMGLRTCGEAVGLFVDERENHPSEAPLGDCPHGHRDAALAYLMYGIEPTEPCPDCGQIPNFGDVSMSPDLYRDGPVKGVDGQVYTTCPECGEDALELRGEGVGRWGWNIACLNCEWETKQAEGLDIAQYCDLVNAGLDLTHYRRVSIDPPLAVISFWGFPPMVD